MITVFPHCVGAWSYTRVEGHVSVSVLLFLRSSNPGQTYLRKRYVHYTHRFVLILRKNVWSDHRLGQTHILVVGLIHKQCCFFISIFYMDHQLVSMSTCLEPVNFSLSL